MKVCLADAHNSFPVLLDDWSVTDHAQIISVTSEQEQIECLLLMIDHLLGLHQKCEIICSKVTHRQIIAQQLQCAFKKNNIHVKILLENHYSEDWNVAIISKPLQNYPHIYVLHSPLDVKILPSSVQHIIIIKYTWIQLPSMYKAVYEYKAPLNGDLKAFYSGLCPVSPPQYYLLLKRLVSTVISDYHLFSRLYTYLIEQGPQNFKHYCNNLLKKNDLSPNSLTQLQFLLKSYHNDTIDPKIEFLFQILAHVGPEPKILVFVPNRHVVAYLVQRIQYEKLPLQVAGDICSNSSKPSMMTSRQEKELFEAFQADEFQILVLDKWLPYKWFSLARMTHIILYGDTIEALTRIVHEISIIDEFQIKINLIYLKGSYEEVHMWHVLKQ